VPMLRTDCRKFTISPSCESSWNRFAYYYLVRHANVRDYRSKSRETLPL
jgi:hypothetical protein